MDWGPDDKLYGPRWFQGKVARVDVDSGKVATAVDGFGVPAVAFTICTFWLIEALARVGRVEEARTILDRVRAIDSPLGLLAEDVEPKTGVMWGNFPQAYSHVGMIHAAFAASPSWSEVE